jgi:hypothetical protein
MPSLPAEVCHKFLKFGVSPGFVTERRSVRRLLVMANVPNPPIAALMMEVLSSSETSVLTRAT